MKKTFIIIVVIVVIVAVGGFWYVTSHQNPPSGGIACTQEAKLCPDGSYVGRTGPNCEFTACPVVSSSTPVDTSHWKTYTNNEHGFTLKYPPDWQIATSTVAITIGHPITGMHVYSLEIYVEPNPQQLLAPAFVDSVIASSVQPEIGGLHFDRRFSLRVNGIQAEELYNVFEYDQNGEQIFVSHNREAIKFDFPVADANPNLASPAENNALVHQMLNTLVIDPSVGKFCGGIATGAFPCASGYSCKLDGTYPDASGHCVKQ